MFLYYAEGDDVNHSHVLWKCQKKVYNRTVRTTGECEGRKTWNINEAFKVHQTSVDGEVLHRDGRGHLSDVVQVFFSQTGGGAAHGLWLTVQSEKT